MSQCPFCTDGELQPCTAEHSRELDGTRFAMSIDGLLCSACNERIFSDDEVERFEQALTKSMAYRPPGREGFRWLRRRLGLSGVEVAELLGTTPETVSRWETGKRDIDKSMWVLLGRVAVEAIQGRSDTRAALLLSREKREPDVRIPRQTWWDGLCPFVVTAWGYRARPAGESVSPVTVHPEKFISALHFEPAGENTTKCVATWDVTLGSVLLQILPQHRGQVTMAMRPDEEGQNSLQLLNKRRGVNLSRGGEATLYLHRVN